MNANGGEIARLPRRLLQAWIQRLGLQCSASQNWHCQMALVALKRLQQEFSLRAWVPQVWRQKRDLQRLAVQEWHRLRTRVVLM